MQRNNRQSRQNTAKVARIRVLKHGKKKKTCKKEIY
jgi:hypothetical protein